jgi:hypothetical protein
MTGGMISPPHTYSEWVNLLGMLKNKTDDEQVLNAMQQGSLEWQSGVAERFVQKLIDTINFRMNQASDHFQVEMTRAHGQERAIVQALMSLRREMRFLAEAVNLNVIPEKDRARYRQLVIDQADTMQKSLEDSAKKDRTGKLASLIRNNRVNLI